MVIRCMLGLHKYMYSTHIDDVETGHWPYRAIKGVYVFRKCEYCNYEPKPTYYHITGGPV